MEDKENIQLIKTIDLWTECKENHYECFNGAFVDGFENNRIPFNKFKIIKNCNCIITSNKNDIKICNKHNAIIFYNKDVPVRLMCINKDTNVEKCVNTALNQLFDDVKLKDIYEKEKIEQSIIDLKEAPIFNQYKNEIEIDVGSCDRWKLLYNMLKGSYTEDDTNYGNHQSDNYEFLSNLYIKYELKTDKEEFIIEHKCAFINELKTRLIPIQENSRLVIN